MTRMSVTRKKRESPLYIEIAEELEQGIHSGEYRVGERLPTEQELAGRYGINRHTAAQALNFLQSKGLVVRVRGRGTFVRPGRLNLLIAEKASFSEFVSRLGLVPSHKVLSVRRIGAYGRLAEELRVPSGEPLVALERVGFAGEVPLVYNKKHFRERLFPGLREHLRGEHGSLRALIRARYGLELYRALSTFEIEPADPEISRNLGVPQGSSLLTVERLDTLEDGTPAEWGVSYFRGDATRVQVEIREIKGEED